MATEVISPKEIILNSVNYPLLGKIRPQLTSVFPEKQVVGDFTLVSDPYVDTWILSDQRGGILIEEMDETKHPDRCYWSTCNLGFKGHIILPHLASSVTIAATSSGLTYSLVLPNAGFEDDPTGWAGLTRSSTKKHTGTYSGALASGAGGTAEAYLDIAWHDEYKSKGITFSAYITHDNTSSYDVKIGINDGQNTTYSTLYNGGAGVFGKKTVTKTLAANATRLRLLFWYDYVTTGALAYIDSAALTGNISIDGDVACFATFNGVHYMAKGSYLQKRTATNFTTVKSNFGAAITALVPTDDYLYIILGDSLGYWYMDTDEACLQTSAPACKFGIYWDDKLFIADSNAQLWYCASPAASAPDFTKNGQIPIDDNNLQALYPYYNVDGDDVIYAREKGGVWVHDYANAKWVRSQLQIPIHTNGAKGGCIWRDGSFISSGLDVIKYVPDVPAQIISMGLDKDDGMPVEHAGEIVYMTPGYNEMYVAVDASQVAGTGYSTIMAYDGKGWQCKWADASADSAIHAMDVSSVSSYALWFDDDNVVYNIPLHRNLRNPLKISTDTHALAGVHITPWFDADWQVGNKLALRFKVNVLGDVSADEDIVVRYRTDHATSAIASTNFTTLGTIETSGLTTYNFASSVGLAFKAIQFRFDLARAAGSTTETPDIQYAVLEYVKIIPKRWGWRFTVDCSQDWHGRTSKQLIDALITAAELETLVTLVYDTTTLYVQIKSVTGERETGRTRKGQYEVFCTELF